MRNEERIFELEGHAHDYADAIATLIQSLEEEQDLRMALEASKSVLKNLIIWILLNLKVIVTLPSLLLMILGCKMRNLTL
jgi:hypothetical protein